MVVEVLTGWLFLRLWSAYKIVNNRAYHHGTMLISTRLDALGDLLRSNKVGPTVYKAEHDLENWSAW